MVPTARKVVKVTTKIYTTTEPRGSDSLIQIARRRPAPSACGFTIAEILLVVVLIALIAGAGSGIYLGTYRNMLAKKAARDFMLAAKYARIVAIERQRPCRIEFDQANNRFWLTVDEINEETEEAEPVMVRDLYFKPIEFTGNVKFEGIVVKDTDLEEVFESSEQPTIVFSPNGTAQSAIVQIGDGDNHYTVSICAGTGRVKVWFGTAENVEVGTIDLDEI